MSTSWIFEESKLPHGAFPFDRLKEGDFLDAVKASLVLARRNVAAIKENPTAPTFENTITALEKAGEEADFVAALFNNILGAHSTPGLQSLSKEILPLFSDYASDLFLDEELFKRVDAVRSAPGTLNAEEKELLHRTFRAFEANGVNLPIEKKTRLRAIDQELTLLARDYEDRGLEATKKFELHLASKDDVAGMPEHWVEAAAEEAKRRGKSGWMVTLAYPSMGPFLSYADRRDLREKVWFASGSRGMGGETDTREIVRKIVALRFERAQLLGYRSHAAYTVEDRMAEKPEVVRAFMDRVAIRARPAAEKEVAQLKKISGLGDQFMPWDLSYYSEKLKAQQLGFNEEELRPFFPLEAAFDGLKKVTESLFGIRWKELSGIPVYHPEVRVFEILDRDSTHLGLLYLDLFPRDSKRSGAWMTHFRDQGIFRGKAGRPHVSIVCNFAPATGDKPSLLSPSELSTLFHEAGHALHLLLSKVKHRSLAGVNVAWDFVELPSQLMEAWATEPEAVLTYARHYLTGEKPPRGLLEKLKRADQFLKGLFWIRQMTFAEIDWAWHDGDPTRYPSVEELEQKVRSRLSVLPLVEGTAISTFFGHLFGGGYAAGYYSYAWADVLAADAFEAFHEEGILNSATGNRLRREVLEKGGSERPALIYRQFRGRDPDPDALFRREGLI